MDNVELKKWAEKHPPIISIFGSCAAASAEAVSGYLTFTKNKPLIYDSEHVPPLNNWLKFYKNQNHIRDAVIGFLKEFEGISEFLGNSWEFILQNPNWLKESRKEYEKASNQEKLIIFEESKTLVNEIQNLFFGELNFDLEESIEDGKIRLFELAEIKFLYSVIIPCYSFYGVHPLKIYKRARKGDIDSIDKILRLDPSALGDPFIFKHFHIASKQENRENFNTMINALQKPPKGKLTLQKIKYKLAGLISLASESISHKLPVPEIEKLFDALSIDLNRPELKLVETDDIYNDSIAKNIRREKRFWHRYFKMDKK